MELYKQSDIRLKLKVKGSLICWRDFSHFYKF